MAEAEVDSLRTGNLPSGMGRGDKIVALKVTGQDTETVDTGLDEIYSVFGNSSADGHIVSFDSVSGGTVTVGLMDDSGSAVGIDETLYITAIGRKE